MAKLHGKQIRDNSASLNVLSGEGSAQLTGDSAIYSGYTVASYSTATGSILVSKDYVDQIAASQSISIQDYDTGASFSNVQNIIFRGNTLTVPGGTAFGVLAAADQQPNSVVVWIPAPNYVENFNSSNTSTTNRQIPNPNSGDFFYGDWTAGSVHGAVNTTTINYTSGGEFSIFNNTSTVLTATLKYWDDNSSAAPTLTASHSVTLTGNSNTSASGITIAITNFDTDNDRYKAEASITFNLSTIIPTSGRFSIELEHNNLEGIYTFNQDDIFYDADGSSSSATIGGASMSENTAVIRYRSGVELYDNSTIFDVQAYNMDNMNQYSYPTGTQLELDYTNMANTSTPDFSEGDFTGWIANDNVQDLSLETTVTFNQNNQSVPGFQNNTTNNLNTSNVSRVNAEIFDWGSVTSVNSPNYTLLIDTIAIASSDYDRNTEMFETESERLAISTISADASADDVTNATVPAPTDTYTKGNDNAGLGEGILDDLTLTNDLQQLWGRLIFPQHDFTTYQPTNTVDYSSCTASTINFNLVDNIGDAGNTPTFSPTAIDGFRWYCRKFDTNGGTILSGVIELDGNVQESDLNYYYDGTAILQKGNDNFRVYISVDGKCWASFDSEQVDNGDGVRATKATYNLDNGTKQLQFSFGSNTSYWSTTECYLLVGIKDSATNLYLDMIEFTTVNWD